MRVSYIWAGLMTAAIVGWMATGEIIEGGTGDTVANAAETADDTPESALQTVRVRTFHTEMRQNALLARGRTEAADRVSVLAETAGLVDTVAVDKGDRVEAGALLCRIEVGARKAHLLETEARLDQAELDLEATSKLSDKGFATAAKLRADTAAKDAAAAALAQMKLDIERLEIKAPFAGIVEAVPVEKGSLLSIGNPCATVVAMNPMRVVAQISERDIGHVSPGAMAEVSLVTGQTARGPVRYIAPAADPTTRTFRTEIEIENPDSAIREGVTADIRIGLDSVPAHRLRSSLLTLNDDGEVGVRTVDPDDMVVFMPVTVISDDTDSLWVGGLPDDVTIITVGQDYVVDGQKVKPVMTTAEAAR
ncbi:MAG: efflux RND transporter periplasmic adaptor subunit [Rhodobiaceae bacterium]|nr:efflux RND transporter periplasmic adaptor subunit [Rhodobiaceae bacterium]